MSDKTETKDTYTVLAGCENCGYSGKVTLTQTETTFRSIKGRATGASRISFPVSYRQCAPAAASGSR